MHVKIIFLKEEFLSKIYCTTLIFNLIMSHISSTY